ncbi:hypothetical protein Tco_0041944, partial [Tanacetum coccineum]
VIEQLAARSGMDLKMAKTCYHSHCDVRTLMMDKAHASRYLVNTGADKTYYDLRDMYGGHVWRRILLPMLAIV